MLKSDITKLRIISLSAYYTDYEIKIISENDDNKFLGAIRSGSTLDIGC